MRDDRLRVFGKNISIPWILAFLVV